MTTLKAKKRRVRRRSTKKRVRRTKGKKNRRRRRGGGPPWNGASVAINKRYLSQQILDNRALNNPQGATTTMNEEKLKASVDENGCNNCDVPSYKKKGERNPEAFAECSAEFGKCFDNGCWSGQTDWLKKVSGDSKKTIQNKEGKDEIIDLNLVNPQSRYCQLLREAGKVPDLPAADAAATTTPGGGRRKSRRRRRRRRKKSKKSKKRRRRKR